MDKQNYGTAAVFMHWLAVLFIAAVFPLALWMGDLEKGPEKTQVLMWHQSVGLMILALVVLRLVWRGVHGAPQHALSGLLDKLAAVVQIALYGLMVLVPIVGWMTLSAGGHPATFFGWFSLPDLLNRNHPLHETLGDVHQFLAYTMLALIAVHILGALKHYYVMHDDVMARMMPWLKAKK
jgi:cytochrome b561